jgi:Protein of unknown function (DUF3089)
MNKFFYVFAFFFVFACRREPIVLKTHFEEANIPPKVDYSLATSWAALPEKVDMADSVPLKNGLSNAQGYAKVDVFFIHPTIFVYEPTNNYHWNGDVNDKFLNDKTDKSTILNQATAFNGSCRVFAPRYRQAHYYSFVTKNKDDSKKALELAYTDVKDAFDYYLKNANKNRPIIIASHSQGTVHAKRLLKEYFDGSDLQKKLVVAYIVGIAVSPETFTYLKPSQSPNDIGCFAAWNTFAKGYIPKSYDLALKNSVSTNPLNWSSTNSYASYSANLGGVGPKFKFFPNVVDAENYNGLLWVNKPKIPGSFLVHRKVWHIADINFFWMNIRENSKERIEAYFKKYDKN